MSRMVEFSINLDRPAPARARRLDCAQGFDGAHEGLALLYDAVGWFKVSHLGISVIRFGSGGGVGRPQPTIL